VAALDENQRFEVKFLSGERGAVLAALTRTLTQGHTCSKTPVVADEIRVRRDIYGRDPRGYSWKAGHDCFAWKGALFDSALASRAPEQRNRCRAALPLRSRRGSVGSRHPERALRMS
jgi:hypothetical protein